MAYKMPQSVRDALADAETLRLNIRTRAGYATRQGVQFYRIAKALRTAIGTSVWAIERARDGDSYDRVGELIATAARAAFRAVPALRIPDFEAEEE